MLWEEEVIPLDKQQPPYKLVLAHHRSPGDSLVLSAALRSLHLTYPGEYQVALDVTAGTELYQHNPDVTHVGLDRAQAAFHQIEYDQIHQSNQTPVTFMAAFCWHLGQIIGRPLELKTNRPHIVLGDEEKLWCSQVQEILGKPTKFAVVNAGTKRDYTVKGWGHQNYQNLINRTRDRIQWVQVGTPNELHRPLDGVIDLIGKTSIRQLIRLVYHAEFCVGPTTLLQHIAAALERPYVAILSGMEPLSWSSPYPTQISLSTHGRLPCCRTQACWRSRVVPLGDTTPAEASLCHMPVSIGKEIIPACMSAVTVDRVAEAVEQVMTYGRIRLA